MAYGREKFIRETRGGVGSTTNPSGRNRKRIREARENRTLNRPPRWDQKIGDKIRSGVGNIPGLAGMVVSGAKSAWEGQARARENERILGGDIPTAVRQSVMTPSDQAFYDKYMRLGDMRSGKEAQKYYDMANTARRNQQISNRINYGLGISGLDETPWEGHESYKDGSRFNKERFNESIRGLGESVIEGDGVTSLVDEPEEIIDYGRETFDIHPDKYPITDRVVEDEVVEDVYKGPRPHEGLPLLPVEAGQPPLGAVDVTGEWVPPGKKEDIVDDITVTDIDSDLPFHSRRSMFPRDNKRVIPGHTTSYVDRFAPIEEEIVEEVIPSIPFDDSVREAGIASLYGQGPQWGGTNRRYEDEYRDYVERSGNMVGGPMTYEEFSESWEDIHQGKPHAGLR